MKKYSMGIDYGTLSGRAVIIDIETGETLATAVENYPHAVMSDTFLDGSRLPADFALQHPQDYLDVLYSITNAAIKEAGIDAKDIIGIGVDFTASTVLPVKKDGTPLCFADAYKHNPHAYVKLWKHHAAQPEADQINALAREMDCDWLKYYGGIVSCEWMLPKVLEVLHKDEGVFEATDLFVEAADWLVWQLTGKEVHAICPAGFKACYTEKGFPDKAFLKKLDARLENIIGDKISDKITYNGEIAGYVTEEMAKKTGLCPGTPVHPALIDAHAGFPALGIAEPGALMLIIGTSSCHLLFGENAVLAEGTCGMVKGGVCDGMYAYEAGQACVGDSFDWYVKNCVPAAYVAAARAQGVSIHKYLREKAEKLGPGAGGVLALDWMNGNRTPYVDSNLSGMLVGLTVNTTPEQIYRALIEATAYGTKRIMDVYEAAGIEIHSIYASGGIADKDAMLMQIYADVTGREIKLSAAPQGCAYGSAIIGAIGEGGYADYTSATKALGMVKEFSYKPNAEAHKKYLALYKDYVELSEYFAKQNDVMKRLKAL